MTSGKIAWKQLFSPTIRSRALSYFRAGKVKKIAEEEDGTFTGTVRGTRNYQVTIGIEDDKVSRMTCSCPYAEKGEPCKHEAAMLYQMEQDGLLALKGEPEEELAGPGELALPGGTQAKRAEAVPAEKAARAASARRTKGASGPGGAEEGSIREPESGQEKVRAEHEEALRELVRKDIAEASDEEDTEASFVVDNYHFYDTQSMVREAGITKSAYRKAAAFFNGDGAPYLTGAETGYLWTDKGKVRGGRCLVYDGNRDWHVALTYTQDKVIRADCSRCYFHDRDSRSSLGHVPCEHEAAAVLLLADYLDEADSSDATSDGADIFLDRALPSKEQTLRENTSGQVKEAKGSLSLNVRLETPRGDDGIYAAFYIGSNRMYKVRDLKELLEGFSKKEARTFGKSTELYLSEESLDEKSARWFAWLKEQYDEFCRMKKRLSGQADDYGYRISAYSNLAFPQTLLLDEGRIDRYFDLQKGQPVEYTKRTPYETTKSQLTLKEGSLDLKLKISPVTSGSGQRTIFEGVDVTGSGGVLLRGKDYIYQLTASSLTRVKSEYQKLCAALCDVCSVNGEISLTIGRSRLNEFWHRVLPQLKETADVTIEREDYITRYIVPDPQYHFYLDEADSVVYGQAEVSYGPERYQLGDWDPGQETPVTEGFRKRSSEYEVYQRFARYLPEYDIRHNVFYASMDDDQIFNLLDHGLQELMDIGEVHVTDHFKRLRVRKFMKVQVGVSLESGLMDLKISSEDLEPQELLDILSAYRRKNHYIRLKSGDFLKLDGNVTAASLQQMMEEMNIPLKNLVKGHMTVPAYRALYLDNMLAGMEDVYENRDSHFRTLVRAFKSVEDSDFQAPAGLNAKLRGYQEEGYGWLRTLDEYGFGGILADEMGLGKTLQVICCMLAVKEEQKESGTGNTSLIVCPASLVYNWGEELKRFAPSLSTVLIAGTAAERAELIRDVDQYDAAVTSYDLLKRDIDQYDGHSFRFAVVDEAQNMKNPMTAAAKSVKLIHAKTRFALTGTPIENRLSELWSIFDFVMPGYLYDYRKFRTEIEVPVTRNNDQDAMDRIRRMVSPFILRRQKKDVLKDLPDKLEEVRYARMDKKQQRIYDAEVTKMKAKLRAQSDEEISRSRIQILAELTKIRQICCDPSLLFSNYDGDSAKTDMCMELIRSLIEGQHRTLVFSQFTSMFDILEKQLEKEGIAYYKITGETPKKRRLELVHDFNTGTVPLFLISLKAGGTGLNLTGADAVIHYDPWWNTAAQDQATDRAHRIGQTKTVTVFRLIVKGTIEEKIMDLQESKKKLSDDILEGENISAAVFDKDDLMDLLG